MDLESLTEKELKIYKKAYEKFKKNRTYELYTKKGAIDLRDRLHIEYVEREVKIYRKHKNYYDSCED